MPVFREGPAEAEAASEPKINKKVQEEAVRSSSGTES